jgi:hypothetical protein
LLHGLDRRPDGHSCPDRHQATGVGAVTGLAGVTDDDLIDGRRVDPGSLDGSSDRMRADLDSARRP